MAQQNPNPIIYNILRKLIFAQDLTGREAALLFTQMLNRTVDAGAAKSALVLLREKQESPCEIAHAVRVLLTGARTLNFDHPNLVDNCGTGGDGKGSFNVSTISALVAAAAGAYVAKHGNRSVSSKVGSSDLLEALGVRIDAKPATMLDCLRKLRIGYFHAPYYHQLMKDIAPIRKSIKGRTVFNLLGPLLNPVRVKKQVIGVSRREFVKRMAESVRILGTERALILHGEGGMDEATPFGTTHGMEMRMGKIRPFTLSAKNLGFTGGSVAGLRGGNVNTNKRIALDLLRGDLSGVKKNAVLLNAGVTLVVSGVAADLESAVAMADETVSSGKALDLLKRLVELSNR